MPPVVIVATARLRHGLLDLLADESRGLDEALRPVAEQEASVGSARSHYAKARAIGDLLDDIGWVPEEITPPYRLDIAIHAWAAITALRRVIVRERSLSWRYAAIEEPEASGQAGGYRVEAEHELELILDGCDQARVTITPPSP